MCVCGYSDFCFSFCDHFLFGLILQGCRFGPESKPNPEFRSIGTICGFVSENV